MGERRRETPERRVSEEEATLFAQAMADVERTPRATPSLPPPFGRAREPTEGNAPEEDAGKPGRGFRVERRASGLRPARPDRRGTASGVDRRTARRLVRGEMSIEGRIDLHGMTQAEARRALERFLIDAVAVGRRCVLVITGKGAERENDDAATQDRNVGVLRRSLPRWLALPGLCDKVVAYHAARPRHGGAGAFYILLRRRRS